MGSLIDKDRSEQEQKDEWLEKRKLTVGSSEAAIVLGKSHFGSAYQLWAYKSGLVGATPVGEPAYWGNRLEPIICEEYQIRTGRGIVDLGAFALQYNPKYPFAHGTPDRVIKCFNATNTDGVLEAKNVSLRMAQHWEDGPPVYYRIQVQHLMAITGLEWGAIVALIGGNEYFISQDFQRNDAFIEQMMEAEFKFMQCVKQGVPPAVDGSEATTNALKALYPKPVDQKLISLPSSFKLVDLDLQDTKKRISELENRKNLLENQIREAMGDATEATIDDSIAKYKMSLIKKEEHVVKASSYTQMRRGEIKPPKKKRDAKNKAKSNLLVFEIVDPKPILEDVRIIEEEPVEELEDNWVFG
jgi:putative phage-type endonuclease